MHHLALLLPAVLAAAGALSAQVPPGSAIAGAIGSTTTHLLVCGRGAGYAPVGNLGAADVNALKLDPIDSSVWISQWLTFDLHRLALSGAMVVDHRVVVPRFGDGGGAAIAFDANGNAVVAGGDPNATGGVFSVHRVTGAVTRLVGPSSGIAAGSCNALDADPVTGNLYFGVTGGGGRVYELAAPGYATPRLVATIAPPSVSELLSGIAFASGPSLPRSLFVTTFGSANNTSLLRIDLAAPAPVLVPGLPPFPDLNGIAFDQVRGDLWLIGTAQSRGFYASGLGGVNAELFRLVRGSPAAIDVNDDVPGELAVVPGFVPATPAPITVELAIHCRPGHLGVLGIVSPVAFYLGSGTADASGRFWLKFPDVTIPAGTPGAIQFLGADYDPVSGAVVWSQPLSWPRN
jgi:hypothetical protein